MSLSRRGGLKDLGLTLATVLAVLALVAVVVVRTGVLDGVFNGEEVVPHEFSSVLYAPAEPVPDFTLTGHDGEPFSLSDLTGDVVALYVGYTNCPDICPLTLNNFARVKALLPRELQDQFQVVMLSADPARDTQEVLANYVPFFDSAFIGVTGTEADVAAVLEDWRMYVEYGEPDENGAYLVGHPAFTLLLDRNGNKVLKISHLLTVEQITADVLAVLEAS
jgi:protein SCO1